MAAVQDKASAALRGPRLPVSQPANRYDLRMTQTSVSGLRGAALTIALRLGACVTTDDGRTPIGQLFEVTGGPVQEQTLDARGQLTYHVMAGELAAGRGADAVAAREYLAASQLSARADIARAAVRHALIAGDADLALEASERWAAVAPDDRNAQEAALRVAMQAEDVERSIAAAQRLALNHSGGLDRGVRDVARAIVREQPPEPVAMAVIEALTRDGASSAETHYSRGFVQMEYARYEAALASIEQALAERPGWGEALLLKAGVLIRQDRHLEGIAVVQPALADGKRARERFALARLLIERKAYALAEGQLEQALAEDPGLDEARYALALMALDNGDPDTAEQQLLPLLDSPEQRFGAAYYLGRIAQQRGDLDQARTYYRQVGGGQHAVDALSRRALLMARDGNVEQAQLFLRGLAGANPRLQRQLSLVEGEMLLSLDKADAAVARYTELLDEFPDDPDMLYGRSLAYERAGEIDAAQADLRRMIELDADDARALNALGYIMTNHTTRYREALGYIERALALEPDDPAIIDSMGWVQYRLGNFELARDYLQRAFDGQPDPEVAAHLGEVYWKLGEQARARAIWNDALAEAPDHDVLLETVQRLTQ